MFSPFLFGLVSLRILYQPRQEGLAIFLHATLQQGVTAVGQRANRLLMCGISAYAKLAPAVFAFRGSVLTRYVEYLNMTSGP
jgi:hypothetical protein